MSEIPIKTREKNHPHLLKVKDAISWQSQYSDTLYKLLFLKYLKELFGINTERVRQCPAQASQHRATVWDLQLSKSGVEFSPSCQWPPVCDVQSDDSITITTFFTNIDQITCAVRHLEFYLARALFSHHQFLSLSQPNQFLSWTSLLTTRLSAW